MHIDHEYRGQHIRFVSDEYIVCYTHDNEYTAISILLELNWLNNVVFVCVCTIYALHTSMYTIQHVDRIGVHEYIVKHTNWLTQSCVCYHVDMFWCVSVSDEYIVCYTHNHDVWDTINLWFVSLNVGERRIYRLLHSIVVDWYTINIWFVSMYVCERRIYRLPHSITFMKLIMLYTNISLYMQAVFIFMMSVMLYTNISLYIHTNVTCHTVYWCIHKPYMHVASIHIQSGSQCVCGGSSAYYMWPLPVSSRVHLCIHGRGVTVGGPVTPTDANRRSCHGAHRAWTRCCRRDNTPMIMD
jgi:hypothetical protein